MTKPSNVRHTESAVHRSDSIIAPFEVRSTGGGDETPLSFDGYASVFGVKDSYGDIIQPGAFEKTLATWRTRGKLPKMLLQHGGGWLSGSAEDKIPIGQWTAMAEDSHGLRVSGQLLAIDTDRQRTIAAATRAKELDGLSIGFFTRGAIEDPKTDTRTITEIELLEVSLVVFPASDPARVTAVRAALDLPSEREFERWLRREAGLSKAQAKVVVASGYRQMRREAVPSDEACGDLVTLLQQRIAIFTGDQRHGTHPDRSANRH